MRRLLIGSILILIVAALGTLGSQGLPGGDPARANHGATAGQIDILAVDTDITNIDTVNGGAPSGNNYHERNNLPVSECDGVIDDDGDGGVDDGCPAGGAPSAGR